MRTLKRNQQPLYYSLYSETSGELDEWGNPTSGYLPSVKINANISAARGENATRQFGDILEYDKVIVFDNQNLDIDESSVLWVDRLDTSLPHDYIVKKIARSLNGLSVSVKKVNVSKATI